MVKANATKCIAKCKLVDGREVYIKHLTFETEPSKMYAGFAKGLLEREVIFQTIDDFKQIVQAVYVRNIVSFTIIPVVEKDFTRHRKAQESVEGISVTHF